MARRKTTRKRVKALQTFNTFIVLGACLLILAFVAMYPNALTVLAHVR